MEVKEHSYICPDLVKEFNKYDTERPKYTGIKPISKKEFSIDVGYDRFLELEIFFSSRIFLPRPDLFPGSRSLRLYGFSSWGMCLHSSVDDPPGRDAF